MKAFKKIAPALAVLAFLLFLLFPFYWTLVTSLKPYAELTGKYVTYWPQSPSLDAYVKLFRVFEFMKPLSNSLLVALSTIAVSLTVSVLAAYAFSRYVFPGRKVLMSMFLTNNMFPTVLLLIPLYAIMRQLGLLYKPMSLILAYTTFSIPFSVWLLTGYLNDLPISLEEAAMVDGCHRGQAFMRVVIPILIPGILATGVYIFMSAWNEYTFASIFTSQKNRTIPVALTNLVGAYGVEWDLMTAGGIVTVLPICIMFFFAQKRLVEGLTAGAVKG